MSPVLTQAATTRNFDIQDEIEFKDDLDKKPDDLFVQSITEFIEQLNKFSQLGYFDWNLKSEYAIESFAFCESDNLPSFEGSGSINRRVDSEIERTAIGTSKNLLAKIAELKIGGEHDRIIDYKFSFDKESLTIQTKVKFENEKKAEIFNNELIGYLSQPVLGIKPSKEKIVAENTKVTLENNQVFIVTRLPRGSLDNLLKQDAKAEK